MKIMPVSYPPQSPNVVPISIHPENQPIHSKRKHMKKIITFMGIASIGVVLALISACETTSAGGGAASQPQTTATTTRQTTTMTNAAENRMSQPIGYRDLQQGTADPTGGSGF